MTSIFSIGCMSNILAALTWVQEGDCCHANDWIGGDEGLDRFGGGDRRHGESRECPDCEAALKVSEDVVLGEILSCGDCGLELEVKWIDGGSIGTQELAIEGEDWGE